MSVDLRDSENHKSKITYLNGQSASANPPSVYKYMDIGSYYEIRVEGFSVGQF